MSSRSKKTTTTTTTSSRVAAADVTTPVSAASKIGTPGSKSVRSPSPTTFSRLQEKNELAALNDRLATYIERVRQLETENTRLSKIIETQEESVTVDLTKIKVLYEDELSSARRMLDELSKEKAQLQVEVGRINSELKDVRAKLAGKEKDFSDKEKRLIASESRANDLQAKLNDSIGEKQRWEEEFNKLKKEFDGITKSLALAKKQLEEETVKRVDLENRIQSLKEEMAFNKQVHQQYMNESVNRSRVIQVEESMDQSLQDSLLADALQEMREDNDEQLRLMRIEMETVFEKKLSQLRGSSEVDGGSANLQNDLKTSKQKIDNLMTEITRLTAQNTSSEMRIRDLESRLKQEIEDNQAAIQSFKTEINHLKQQLDDQLLEYSQLMDVKIQLDTEIAAYRKLLESEEGRLNLSPGGSRKRKRVELEEGSSSRSGQTIHQETLSDFSTSSSAKDVIEISETSPEGKFVKLFNTSSDKEVALAGWQLKHFVGTDETVFKFTRNAHMKPQHSVTVWSTDSEQTNSPPDNLVMKNMKWFPGNISKTVLVDQTGEEKATRETKKSTIRTTTSSGRHLESSVDAPKPAIKPRWGWGMFSLIK